MSMDPNQFRATLAQFASGVTVVTTEHEGQRYGITVSAFASLSLEPPLVLICVEKTVRSHDGIAAGGHFAVNILSERQQELSNRFASRSPEKFAGLAMREGELGDPLLDGCLANLECVVREALPGGDHTIFVGEVMHSHTAGNLNPLLYFRGGYHEIR